MVSSERGIHLTVFIEVGRDGPGAVVAIQKENHAFADVDEDADSAAASGEC